MTGIAVWGIGPHALKNVLPAIAATPGFELVGVCSRSEARRKEASAAWGGKSWETAEDMLRSDRVEVVYLATPTGLHASQGLEVLGSGRHLLCEKSLTADARDSLALVECAEKNKLLLCETLAFLYHPRFLTVRELIGRPAFGRVVHAFCTFGLPTLAQPGFRTSAALGGGALLDVGCYPLSAMRVLFGEKNSVMHSAITTLTDEEVDTSGEAVISFASGLRGEAAWGYNRAYSASLFVWGERQSLYVNRLFSKETVPDSGITLRDNFGDATTIAPAQANAFVEMFAEVQSGLRDDARRRKFLDDAASQAKLLGEVKRCAN